MKRSLFLLMAGLLMACGPSESKEPEHLLMLVGTYTDTGSCGVYSYSVDPETAVCTLLDSVKTANPSYLTWSASGKTVYAVREDGSDNAAIVSIPFEAGRFGKEMKAQKTLGRAPCYVATNGDLLVAANYGGGCMSVFPVKDEVLSACSARYFGERLGPDMQRQEAPHVHCALFTPDNKYVMATDFSADRILSFRIEKQQLVPCDTCVVTPGTAPRHLVFAPNGVDAYVIGELSGAVTAFKYKEGRLTAFQEIQADSLGAKGSGDIRVSSDGRFLYASNRLKGDGIAVFAIDEDGQLTHIGYQDTGRHPRNFCITPNGKFLFCACRDAQQVEVYERDAESGMLKPTAVKVAVKKPVFVGFVEK